MNYYAPNDPNMKKLNEKSFWIILSGVVVYFILAIFSLVEILNMDYSQYITDDIKEQMSAEEVEKILDIAKGIVVFSGIFGLIIAALISAYFITRIIKNRKVPQGQKYISFLFVVSIIFTVFSVISAIQGSITSIISIIAYAALIVGCSLQKKYIPPQTEADMYNSGAYGIPPTVDAYGNPYGAPPAGNPYGNPYGAPPAGNPYGNPYGAPPTGNPYDPNQTPNPYADPQNNNPYGTPPNGDNNNNSNN